jgi:hypothetical protein
LGEFGHASLKGGNGIAKWSDEPAILLPKYSRELFPVCPLQFAILEI